MWRFHIESRMNASQLWAPQVETKGLSAPKVFVLEPWLRSWMGNLGPTTIWEPLRLWKPARCPFDVKFHGEARGWHPFLLILKQKKVMEMSWHPGASLAKPLQKRVLKFESTNCIGSFCNHFCWPLTAQSNNKIQSQKMLLNSCFYLGRSQLSYWVASFSRTL